MPADQSEHGSDVHTQLKRKILSQLDPSDDNGKGLLERIESLLQDTLTLEDLIISRAERGRLIEAIIAEVVGLGPLEPLLADDRISTIQVNDSETVYVVKNGMLTRSNQKFDSPDHLRQIVERLVEPLGIDLDQLPPLIEMTLTDYSLVHIILPPHADDIALTIIRRNPTPLTVQDLFQFGTLSPEEAEFLRACVVARVNVMIVGRKGVGKTTLLNVLGNFIPENERIITIEKHEKQPELQLPHDNRIALKTNAAGSDTQALVAHSLRMMPDRLIVGDCMGAEVAEVIQAVYHGVDGVLITVTANGIDDAIRRLETMSQLANDSRPQQQIGTAFDCIVHLERLEDGSRKITQITEALRKGSESIELKDIFTFEQTAEEQGKVIGRHRRTGYRPTFIPKIEAAGIVLPPTIYSRPIPGER